MKGKLFYHDAWCRLCRSREGAPAVSIWRNEPLHEQSAVPISPADWSARTLSDDLVDFGTTGTTPK
jgi:hypothetical protein